MSFIPTQTSVDEAQRKSEIAVLPVGAFEQHGAHLPLATDTIIAGIIAKELAEAYDLFLLPPISIGCSHEHAAFAGTVSISASTMIAIIDDIRESLVDQGIDKLVIVNAHGGNYVLSNIVQQANVDGPKVVLYPTSRDWTAARVASGMETSNSEDMHAGELETSLLLYAAPEVVAADADIEDHVSNERHQLLVHGVGHYTTSGVIGRPSLANPTKGKSALSALVADFELHLAALTTDEF